MLASGGEISGRVVLDGVPLPRFGIALSRPNVIDLGPREIRNDEGKFVLPHIAPGAHWLRIWGPGCRHTVIDISVEHGASVDLGDVIMKHGQRVTGHVRDRAGAPVHDARIQIGMWGPGVPTDRSQMGGWFQGYFESRTDENGEYVFAGIDAHVITTRSTHIWATHGNSASLIAELPNTDVAIDLVLLDAGRIEGVAQGVSRCFVLAHRDDEPPRARTAHGDEENRFEFAHLPVGVYSLSLYAVETEPVQVDVCAGETASAILVPSRPVVDVTVRLPAGRIGDLAIEPFVPGVRMRGMSSRSNEDECRMSSVPAGEYRMSLDSATWRTVTIDPTPLEQTIDLRDL